VRTFNRNFQGRSGTITADIYLVSPETAVATAIYGKITDPQKLGNYPKIELPKNLEIDDSMIIEPSKEPESVKIIRGPNIAPLPEFLPLPEDIKNLNVLIKVGDNITTDDIMPAGAKILPFRSNLPKISEFVFIQKDPDFPNRAIENKNKGLGLIIGGNNYGQGSSREHAALAPMYLGIKVVLTKSFARIHRDNLVNFGIVPLIFDDAKFYNKINLNDELQILKIRQALKKGDCQIKVKNVTQNFEFAVNIDLSERERNIIIAGGKLNFT